MAVTQTFLPRRSDTTLFIFKQVKQDETLLKLQPKFRPVSLAFVMKNTPNKPLIKERMWKREKRKLFYKTFIYSTSVVISRNVDCVQHRYMTPGEVGDVSTTEKRCIFLYLAQHRELYYILEHSKGVVNKRSERSRLKNIPCAHIVFACDSA